MQSPGRALTLSEARERSRLLDVARYDVELHLGAAEETFRSTTTIRFRCTEPGAATFVEIRPTRLLAATLNGVALDPASLDENRLPLPALDADNVLVVEAELPYVTTGDGMHRYVDPVDGEVYVGAYLGVDNAQRVLACFDQPDLKAEFALRVRAPEGWTVVGNGLTLLSEDGLHVLEPTPRISPYLVTVVAGPWASVRTTHRGVPFHLHARRSLGRQLEEQAEEILTITTSCFDRYTEMFDEPYPFTSYGHAFVPELNWHALEQPGCVLVLDSLVFTSAVTEDERLERAMVLAHEMAHMWFGDLVTLRWWDDIWLNESFAEYMGFQLLTEATGHDDAWVSFATTTKAWGYDSDRRRSSHPVAPAPDDVADTEAALNNFDGISYAKGASALRQLAAWLGHDRFLAGINLLLTRHRFGSASLDDVLDALAEASGRDVHGWASSWLRTTGTDTLRVVEGGGALEHPGVRPHLVAVGVYDRTDSGALTRRALPLVELPEGTGRVDLPQDAAAPALLLVNDDDLTFALTRLDSRSDAALADSLATLERPLSRAVAWNHLRNRVRDADLDPLEHIALVRRHLPLETSISVIDGVLGFARRSVVDRYLPPASREHALALLRETCELLLARDTDDAGSGLRLAAARAWVESAGAEQVGALRDVLTHGFRGGPGADQDLRWRALTRLRALDAADESEVDAEVAADTTGEGPKRGARARAVRPDAATKAAAWEAMFAATGDSRLSPPLLRSTAEGFWHSGQDDLLAPWVGRWAAEVVRASAERGVAVAQTLGAYAFPVAMVSAPMLDAVTEALADPAVTPALRRALEDSEDDLRRALLVRSTFST